VAALQVDTLCMQMDAAAQCVYYVDGVIDV
jgi:hypothetical protein